VFTPAKGIIKAKSKQVISIESNFLREKKFHEIFVCNVKDMKSPLGFILQCIV